MLLSKSWFLYLNNIFCIFVSKKHNSNIAMRSLMYRGAGMEQSAISKASVPIDLRVKKCRISGHYYDTMCVTMVLSVNW